MRNRMFVLGALWGLAGCGGDAGDSGPGAGMDSGPGADGDSGPDADAGPPVDTGPVVCMGAHPMVMGMRRFCGEGDCYCMATDACFSEATAMACCEGSVVCTGGGGIDAGLDCMRSHPIVGSDGSRTCDPGFCFCADPDSCAPAAVADACCNVATTCF